MAEFIEVDASILEEKEPTFTEVSATPTTKTKQPTARVSNPIKQGIAGITDPFSGLPMVLGMAGSGLEAIYNKATEGPDVDKSFADHFAEASASGYDAALISAGRGMRNFVNERLGIKEAVSTEDQVARLLTSFLLPIPGSSSVSLANKAASFMLPVVRRTAGTPLLRDKGFAARAAAQVGIGTGIDQGMRAAQGMPLLFSDEAIKGQEFSPVDLKSIDPDNQSDDTLEERLREMDKKSEREKDNSNAITTLLIIGGSILAAPVAFRGLKALKTKHGTVRNFGNKVHEDFADQGTALRESLGDVNAKESYINSAVHNSHSKPADIAKEFGATGRIEDITFNGGGIKPKSWGELEQAQLALGPERSKMFDKAMIASTERASRKTTDPADLFPNARTNDELEKVISAAWKDPEIKQLMKDYGDQMEYLLRYERHTGNIDDAAMKRFRETNRLPALGQMPERTAYMPLYTPDERSFMQRLGYRYLGIGNKTRRETDLQSEFLARSNAVDTRNVLTPLQAMKNYTIRSIANAHEQAFKGSVLDKLARITRNREGIAIRAMAGRGTKPPKEVPTARDTTLLGEVEDLTVHAAEYKITRLPGSKADKKFTSDNLAGLQRGKYGDELVTAHVNGKLRVYHVPDKGLRAAIDLNPQISNFERVAGAWKNLFTAGTTGKASPFAPFSHAFSSQQIALNTSAGSGIISGAASVGRSLKGTGKMMALNGAKDISDYLSKRIGRQMGLGNNPVKMRSIQQRLEKYYTNSMLHSVRAASGRTQTGLGNIGTGSTEEILAVYGNNIKDYIGKDQIGLFGKLWDTWNNAWHEGPAYAAMLKHIGKGTKGGKAPSPQTVRDAIDIGKDLAGDMRRVGVSGFARKFNAAVPFSSAMIQSWNSIGKAARANPVKFLAGATALIGAPTVAELTWNSNMDQTKTFTDPNRPDKQWTYEDYYWNGFTTQQRTDNFIYFIPGRPPWEAIVIPVSPEWGLFRSMVIEGLDSVMHLSAVGNMGELAGGTRVDQAKTNRSHMLTALARVLDVPLPPLLSAVATATGAGLQLGLASKIETDPDDPGAGFSLIRNIPIGQGERVTRMGGKTKFAEGHLDRIMSGVIQDIFGAAGAAYVKMHEAFMSEVKRSGESAATAISNLPDTLGTGLSSVGGAFVEEAKRQSRYVQPLLGKALQPSSYGDEITSSLIARKATLERLNTFDLNSYIGAGIVYADGKQIVGDTVIPRDDPVNLQLATSAKPILSELATFESQAAKLKKDLDTIPNARDKGSYKERQDLMAAKTLELQGVRAQQLAIINHYEDFLSEALSKTYDKTVVVDFSKYKPRPDFSEGSILQGLRK